MAASVSPPRLLRFTCTTRDGLPLPISAGILAATRASSAVMVPVILMKHKRPGGGSQFIAIAAEQVGACANMNAAPIKNGASEVLATAFIIPIREFQSTLIDLRAQQRLGPVAVTGPMDTS